MIQTQKEKGARREKKQEEKKKSQRSPVHSSVFRHRSPSVFFFFSNGVTPSWRKSHRWG